MSAGSLDPIERLVLYKAWGKSCVWCKQPVTYRDYQVEHLVPRGLDATALARTLSDYGLPPDFDVLSLENLAVSCGPCNRMKGAKPVRPVPIVRVLLSRAADRAPSIVRKASTFARRGKLDEAVAVIEAMLAHAEPRERRMLAKLSETLSSGMSADGRPFRPGTGCYEPEPPRLKRSKNKLDSGGDDAELMMTLLDEWIADNYREALDLVAGTFDGGDTPPRDISLRNVSFLAYARDLGDFLADVTFRVEYMFQSDDIVSSADAEHSCSVWITLDSAREEVVAVVEDLRDTLETCKGYR